jgi:hypothetical protein
MHLEVLIIKMVKYRAANQENQENKNEAQEKEKNQRKRKRGVTVQYIKEDQVIKDIRANHLPQVQNESSTNVLASQRILVAHLCSSLQI